MLKRIVLALSLLIVAAPAYSKKGAVDRALASLTPSDFQNRVQIHNDELDTVAILTTQPGFQVKRGILNIVSDDNFLRAFIDKKTGNVTYQIYQLITYSGDWRFYETANYETPTGPQSTPVIVIDRSVGSCSRYGCSMSEQIGFNVDEELLKTVANSYKPGQRVAWRFKFTARSGHEWQDGIMAAEVSGLLAAVRDFKAKMAMKPAGS